MYDDPSPVHEEKGTMDSWINDELSWRDVYSKKPEDYLEAIARGETPRWDSDAGKYVYGDSSTSEMSMGGGTSASSSYVDPQANAEPDDDMPF